ncbi:hypothetical protein CLIB1444_01S14642 [[Candida] jaroonii]|uniref:Uncharacterized protein n=1 Tax=[Candida] jaroonii TaxID=467808 RepID=A0ACA9Y1L7_9ASCO|nr:hypothetical protein CLIB1444_01S14642 [[Candida] jaroonii]
MADELDKTIGDVFKQFENSLHQEETTQENNQEDQPMDYHYDYQYDYNENLEDGDNLDDAITNVFDSLKNELEQHQPEEQVEKEEQKEEQGDDDLANAISNALQSINEIRPEYEDKETEPQEEVPEPTEDQHQAQDQEQDNEQDKQQEPKEPTPSTPTEPEKEVPYSPLEMEKDDDLDLENAIGDAFASLKQTEEPQQQEEQDEKDEVDDDDLSKAITDSINMIKDKIPQYQPTKDDEKLQKTIADAMKSVISEPSEPDLNNTQMNDILVNAFNMAMENPQELLNIDEPKKLSIAETLASHGTNNSQLSNILLNLDSSGGIVNIIEQIASFINNSNFQVFKHSNNLMNTIASYKNQPEIFLTSLTMAKHYLQSINKVKCIPSIDNVLLLLGKNNGPLIDYNPNLITLIINSIINVISNYQSSKLKPRNDLEHKEKIRLENRERKKRWREVHSERNKDNDLRARVQRRANIMFGPNGSDEKTRWMDEEFIKRKEKRLSRQLKDKEDVKTSTNKIINDKNLIKLIDDFFTIFSNFSPKDDNETGLYTTTTTMACVGIIYLTKFGYIDVKRIDSIITSVVTNLIEGLNGIDNQERIGYLSKGARFYLPSSTETDEFKQTTINDKDPKEKIDLKFPRYKNQKKEEPKLKKPAIFKRPGYQVKEEDERFPKLYSTTLKP